MTAIRTLVAGLGTMGRSHALAYHRDPAFEIVGLVNRSDPPLPDPAFEIVGLVSHRSSAARSCASTRSPPTSARRCGG